MPDNSDALKARIAELEAQVASQERTIAAYRGQGEIPSSSLSLDERLEAAGLLTTKQVKKAFSRFEVHSGMKDLDAFGAWLERKVDEYVALRGRLEINKEDYDKEFKEWVMAQAAMARAIWLNFDAARKEQAEAVRSITPQSHFH